MRTTTLLLSILLTATLAKTQAQDITGTWSGTLEIQGTQLPLNFNIKKAAEGFSATMDSPKQGVTDLPVTELSFEDSVLQLAVGAAGIGYKGTLKPGDTIKGTFSQRGLSLPLQLSRGEKITRPQDPSAPFPYTAEEVEITNPHDGTTLAGTLTIPEEGEDFPAVILLSGSGPQNRNSALFGHQPFLVLADHFSRNGIAVLRLDDRGIGGSGGELSTTSFEASANDVEAAISCLKTREEIDADEIGLLGHSEGGIIAPLVAKRSSEVAFLVLLAAPVLEIDELMLLQKKKLEEKLGANETIIQQSQDIFRGGYELITNYKGSPEELKQNLEHYLRGKLIGYPENQLNQLVEQLTAPRMIEFLRSKPAACLKNIKIPTLALFGEKDVQVPATENIGKLKESIGSGKENFRIVELENLNHLFQESSTGLPNEYDQLEQTFSPKALGLISGWIKEQTE